jgi:hypothetical protein
MRLIEDSLPRALTAALAALRLAGKELFAGPLQPEPVLLVLLTIAGANPHRICLGKVQTSPEKQP